MLACCVAATVVAAGCSSGGDEPDKKLEAAVTQLADALAKGDVAPVAFTTPDVVPTYQALWKPLAKFPTQVEVGTISESGSGATADLTWTTNLGKVPWTHTSTAELTKNGSEWAVVWKPSILESSLVDGEKLAVTGLKAQRGNILGGNGKPLVEPRPVIRFGIDKAQAPAGTDFAASATRLATLLDVTAKPLVDAVKKAGPKAFIEALVMRRSEVQDRTLAGLENIPGARAISDKRPLAPSRDFAAAILGTVGPATAEIIKKSNGTILAGDDTGLSGLQLRYNEQLAGTSGIKVSAQASAEPTSETEEPEARVLFSTEPVAGTDLTITLDRTLQSKAQQLLTRYGPASALVAVRPSTGEIVVAASGPGSDGYNTATFGQYAPGSTFKVVSSLALLRAGLTPSSTVDCPATVTVNGKRFKNYSDYPSNRLGRITLRQAVANSCNTAFISSRSKIKGTGLADAAAALGFGVDHDMGFPAYFGQVPEPAGETEAAADLIGQGKILASPMAMAAVMASVVHGSTVVPDLIPDDEPVTASPSVPLTEDEAASLRTLLRAVVQEGSGSFLQSLGSPGVLAKTGTAEYGDATKTHTWMIGAQGDLAVAVFVETGQSGSRTAGPVLEDFLRAAK